MGTHTIAPNLYKGLTFDPAGDLARRGKPIREMNIKIDQAPCRWRTPFLALV